MKRSIVLSAIIAVIFAIFGTSQYTRVSKESAVREKLLAEASELGISAEAKDADASRAGRRDRPDREASARTSAKDLIAFAKEMEEFQKNPPGQEQQEKIQKRVLDFMENLASLDAAQIKILIAAIRADSTLGDEMRKGLIGFSVMTLSGSNPRAAIALFTEGSDLLPDGPMNSGILKGALGKWAREDPEGALEWVRTNSKKFPDLITEDTKRGLIAGAAVNDPKIALGLISELGLATENSLGSTLSSIVSAATTSQQRSATLAAIRSYTEDSLKSPDLQNTAIDRSLSQFGSLAAQEGFTAATAWVEDNKLSENELNAFTSGLDYANRKDNGKWVEWIGEKLPPEQAGERIGNIVRQWTRDDYQAAGEWLNTAPAGTTKNTAIRSYAETVAPYEPETAAQWVETLPQGKDRDSAIRKVHNAWMSKDKEAAAAFAEKHGIK
jgi:hypothetical protein